MADNVKTLTDGIAVIRTRDASTSDITVTVAVTPGGTPSSASKVFKRVTGASIKQLEYFPEAALADAPRFFDLRDTVTVATAYDAPPETETAHTQELRDLLPVTIV